MCMGVSVSVCMCVCEKERDGERGVFGGGRELGVCMREKELGHGLFY